MTQQKYTLDDLKARRRVIRRQVKRRQKGMKQSYNTLFSPAQPTQNAMLGFVNNADRIYAVYSGVRTAWRVITAVRTLLGLRRRRR